MPNDGNGVDSVDEIRDRRLLPGRSMSAEQLAEFLVGMLDSQSG
jgi:hypothetical protein